VRVTVRAHAKINLHLQVLGQRADGYHDVVTVLQSLALHDTLTCEARPGPFELRCDRDDVPLDASNLVWRAARLIAEAAGQTEPANAIVTLDKRIPMQAGLGGGSADAAAALVAFARLWQVAVDDDTLMALARRLGADVAFCVRGGTALGVGRGDELTPLPPLPTHHAVIVMPPFGVSTPDAYRWHDECRDECDGSSGASQESVVRWPRTSDEWAALLPSLRNDFEAAVGARYPEVPRTVAALKAAGARFAAMSGSGAAMVGLFGTRAEAESAESREDFGGKGWRTFVTRTASSLQD
jgi:4-diphosphocytidyl-2-C-methyl-D-erythritol kinase